MAEQSGERRLELSGEKVSLWSLIFEKIEKDYLTKKKEREDKMKKILMLLLLLPMIGFGEPNGYFRYNRSNDTFDVIADNALVDTVSVDTIQMDLTFADGVAEGRLQWDVDDGTLEYGLPGGDVTLQVGFEMLMKVSNKSGADISNGVPVYVSGAQGSRPTIELADASVAAEHHVVGLTTEAIDNNKTGYVCVYGYVRDVDTSAWTAGDDLHLSTTAGELTNGIPAYPAEPMLIGTVLFSSAGSGIIMVSPQHDITYGDLANTTLKLKTLELTATNLFNDLRFPFSAVDLPGLGGDPAISIVNHTGAADAAGTIFTLVFAQNDYLFFSPQMSHDYWDGTVLRPHLHSISTGTPITNTYNLVYSYADIGDTFTAQKTNTVTIATSGVAGEHELHNLGNMDALGTLGGTEVSSMVGVKLIRTDAGTGINLLEFDIHYRIRYAGGQQYTP